MLNATSLNFIKYSCAVSRLGDLAAALHLSVLVSQDPIIITLLDDVFAIHVKCVYREK